MSETSGFDVPALADLLHEAAERHHAFETAAAEHEWWDWYAPYVDARLRAFTPEEAISAADQYMKDVKGIERR